jgi:hypothetical protein
MGLNHAPFLPPDGLVMALDPNNTKSYSGTGLTVLDMSGSNNNGVLTNGPTYSNGYISLDGSNDVITIANSTSSNLSDNFTVCMWARIKSAATSVPLGKYVGGSRGWEFVYDQYTAIFGGRNQTADGYKAASAIGTSVSTNLWYFWTGVKSGTSMSVYLNGGLGGTTAWSSAGDMSATVPMYVGAENNGGLYANSDVSQILYYKRVLSADEIKQIYDSTKSRFIYTVPIVTSGLILNYDAGSNLSYQGSGSTWTDLSGLIRHGTITEAVYGGTGSTGYFAFDGSNDVVTSSTFTANVTDKTLAGWVKLSSTSQTGGGLVTLETSGGTYFDSIVYNETSNGWGFGSNNYARTAWSGISETSTSTWVYIAATYSDNNYKLYRNGVLILNTTSFTTYNFNAAGNALVGKRHTGGSGAHLAGQISHAAIYNRALTANEVMQNFNAMKGRYGY